MIVKTGCGTDGPICGTNSQCFLLLFEFWFPLPEVLAEVREELVFKDNIMHKARRILQKITGGRGRDAVVVGVHARRGDKLEVWRRNWAHDIRDILGQYEGGYFRHCMGLMRRRHGEVVFIVTSDDVAWARAQLASTGHNDTFFAADLRASQGTSGHIQARDFYFEHCNFK